MHLVYLSGENIKLGIAEAISLFCKKPFKTNGRVLIFDSKKIPKNLGFTEYIIELFYYSHIKNFLNKTKDFKWRNKIHDTYGVFALSHLGLPVLNISDIIWRALKHPKVSLKNPKHKIGILKDGSNIYAGKILWKNPKGFSKRRAHLRPRNHPTSLNPKLARACINLLGPVKSILDPFCGAGGILLEAGLMGYNIAGFDNNKNMLERCRENLKYFNLKATLKQRDACYPDKRYKHIITDLPYGRNTKNIQNKLYESFLKNITHVKRAVVMFPDKRYISLAGRFFYVEEYFSYYLHKSLTKHILLLKTHE